MPDHRPAADEAAAFYRPYIDRVEGDDVRRALESQFEAHVVPLRAVAECVTTVVHPPYGWTIKQVVGHLIDAERVFGVRALRFARGDATPLPGFDEHEYIAGGEFDGRAWSDLVEELIAVRQGTIALFRSLTPEAWSRAGTANGSPATVRALAYAITGHAAHHLDIVRSRIANAGPVLARMLHEAGRPTGDPNR